MFIKYDNFKAKGQKVYIPHLKKFGIAKATDLDGNITKVVVDNKTVNTVNKVVELWSILNFFYKLIIRLIAKKN